VTAIEGPVQTLMARETAEIPAVVARVLEQNAGAFASLGERLRVMRPPVIVTCGRGSSDHAATYGKYLIETLTGVPVSSAAPSVSSVYRAPVMADGAVMIAISQSGRSPDLLATVAAHRSAGALVLALVNDAGSPLAAEADVVVPLLAGPEEAVAATKSCIVALVCLAGLAAAWREEADLQRALAGLPQALETGLAADWSAAVARLSGVERMFVLGRGYSLGIAQEAALKLKETCAIQAEPFSSAEVRHGPMRLVGRGFPILGFATSDEAGADVVDVAQEFAGWGAETLVAGEHGTLSGWAGHPVLQPIVMLTSFYRMVEELSRARGMDPDSPPRLKKVTHTR
jgi:glucosamine--fructose-6-phosphate aminotransferase (isomerizing)